MRTSNGTVRATEFREGNLAGRESPGCPGLPGLCRTPPGAQGVLCYCERGLTEERVHMVASTQGGIPLIVVPFRVVPSGGEAPRIGAEA